MQIKQLALGMIPAYIAHFIGFALMAEGGEQQINFVQGILIVSSIPGVLLSNLSVVLAAFAVSTFLARYDAGRERASLKTDINP